MEFDLKQFVPSKVCFSCDVCCRFNEQDSVWTPSLADIDIQRLSKELVSKDKKLKTQVFKDIFVCSCFEPKNNNCKIYASRPFECRLYPFLLAKNDGRIFLGLDTKCPFAKEKKGSEELKQFKKYLLELIKQNDIKAVISNNPQLIADYKDDVVFLEELNFL